LRHILTRAGLGLAFGLGLLLPAAAQTASSPPDQTMSAAEKTAKQQAYEEAERLCRTIKDQDKFNECLDLYFLDARKFKAFLDEHGVADKKPPQN
jgi:hypothetical protein